MFISIALKYVMCSVSLKIYFDYIKQNINNWQYTKDNTPTKSSLVIDIVYKL